MHVLVLFPGQFGKLLPCELGFSKVFTEAAFQKNLHMLTFRSRLIRIIGTDLVKACLRDRVLGRVVILLLLHAFPAHMGTQFTKI